MASASFDDAALRVAAVASSDGAIITQDLTGTITSWNRVAEEIFGHRATEAIGQSIRLIVPPELQDEQDEMLRRIRVGEGLDHYDTVRLSKDGRCIDVSLTVLPLATGGGEIVGASQFARRTIERTQPQAILLKAGALQRAIFNSANFSSIATDSKGVIQIFNVGAERMLGYAAADVMNKITPADISDPQELIARAEALSVELGTPIMPGFEALVFKASRGLEDIYELTYIRRDGSRFPAVVSVTALRDAQDAIIGYLLIGTDNTARKQAEEALLKSGALQRAIFNSANFSSIATDAKGVIQIFNVGAERMLGYTAADVMDKVTPADISDPQEVIARAKTLSVELSTPIAPGFDALVFKASRGIEDIYELTYIRKDGSRFPAVVSVTALRDAQDAIIGYLLIGTDNTTRKQAEEALRLAAIVDSTDDGIISTDLGGIITSWNRAAERMFGCSASEMVGQSVCRLIPDDLQDEEDHVLSRIRGGERVEHYETVRRSKDGALIPVALTVSPIQNVDGIVIGASKIVRDISERKRAEDERRRLLTVAQVKSEFLANMSHELRTPLNAIIGFAELMHRGKVGPVSAEHEEYLGDILTSSKHLLQLINDVLDLAKVESGKMEFRLESVDLTKLAREVCDIVRGLAASQRLQVDTHVDPELATVVVDPARVKQILYNYLSNAIKFTPAGGRITIRILPEGPALFRIDVADTGVGIAVSDMSKLFVEFQQLDASAAKTYQGTGLGLALTKKLAEAHGGRVAVRSTLGEGSTFSVILPRVMTMAPADEVARPTMSLPAGNRTILVVDDDPAALKLASLALREMGYRPVCSTDPEAALRTVEADPPGVVIVDLLMPGVDGFEFVSRFRAMPAGRDVPIIVWTVKDLDASERSRLQPSITGLVFKNAGGSRALVGELRRLLLVECVAAEGNHGE
jgi:PAS domain S-box-containing protein